jgi:hypothetical protein
VVYFIQEAGQPLSPVKIGFCLGGRPALRARLQTLQMGNHRLLHAVAVLPGAYEDEQEMHRRCAEQWIRGEWFRYDGVTRTQVELHRLRAPVVSAARDEREQTRLDLPRKQWQWTRAKVR